MNNPQQGWNSNGHSTLSEFMRTSPPTFTETTEPLDADDWMRTIEDHLALVNWSEDHQKVRYASHYLGGTARACWDGFKVMQGDHVITWTDFKEGSVWLTFLLGLWLSRRRNSQR